MIRIVFCTFICILCWAKPAAAQTTTTFTLGHVVEMESKVLSEKRILNIYLPEGYHPDSAARYPVMYVLDGSANEDFIHICGLVQFYNMMFAMPKTIVVGIANVDRRRDFTYPTTIAEHKKKYPTTGGSEAFIRFVETELQPYINSHYKTNDIKYIIGQSLGGLVATEILLKKPGLFNRYIITSPSLWWDNESLLKQADSLIKSQPDQPLYVYVAIGEEGKTMKDDAKKLVTTLKGSGKKNLKVDFAFFPDENHATILHQSVYKALNILFPYRE